MTDSNRNVYLYFYKKATGELITIRDIIFVGRTPETADFWDEEMEDEYVEEEYHCPQQN